MLVTGGTKGVGRGIAQRFADAGATVAVSARNEVDDLPDDWTFLTADLRDGEAAWATIDSVVERLGRLDVLVNNAGGGPRRHHHVAAAVHRAGRRPQPASPRSSARNAPTTGCRRATAASIVNISSVSGIRPSPMSAAYGAAKAGLVNFTMTTAMEWAPKVRVNAITVGLMITEQAHLFYGDEAGIAAVGATVPLGRMAVPSDVGDICLFLASPLASYVTGANLVAHGGGERPPFLDAANTRLTCSAARFAADS